MLYKPEGGQPSGWPPFLLEDYFKGFVLNDERLKQGKRLGKAYFNRLPEALAAYTKNKNFHLGKSINCPNNQDYLTAECDLLGPRRDVLEGN